MYVASSEHAVQLFRELMHRSPDRCRAVRDELAGRTLACWCPLEVAGGPRVLCHADVLLEIANQHAD